MAMSLKEWLWFKLASHLLLLKYIEAQREILETSFQALKIATVSRRQDVKKKETCPSSYEKFSTMIKGGIPSG